MKIGILGSRGIPNQYGGFEELAEQLAIRLAKKGHEVVVYCPHHHPVKEAEWKGVKRILCHDPKTLGTAGQFIYDLNCLRNSRKQNFDALLQLGYTSSSIWWWLWPKTAIVTNMDGLEWKRSKYAGITQRFLKRAEKWAITHSTKLIADAQAIASYLESEYQAPSFFIPYGADLPTSFNQEHLKQFAVEPGKYHLILARLEPENHVQEILAGLINQSLPVLVIGNLDTPHAKQLQQHFTHTHFQFIPAFYNKDVLNSLRHFCTRYWHGHSVGGTNPSLLEAMACGAPIVAHRNPFNQEVLGTAADFFSNSTEVAACCGVLEASEQARRAEANRAQLHAVYQWDKVSTAYERVLAEAVEKTT